MHEVLLESCNVDGQPEQFAFTDSIILGCCWELAGIIPTKSRYTVLHLEQSCSTANFAGIRLELKKSGGVWHNQHGWGFQNLFDVLKCLLTQWGPFKFDSLLCQCTDGNKLCLKIFDKQTQKVYHSTKGITILQSPGSGDRIDGINARLTWSNAWSAILYENVVSHIHKLGSEELGLLW